MGLRRVSLTFFRFGEQCCDSHEVVCKDGGTYEQLESLATFGKTALHTAAPEQDGDAPLDTSPEPLSLVESWALLMRHLLWSFRSATLGDAHEGDICVGALLDIGLGVKTTIGGIELRRAAEQFLVTSKRRSNVLFIGGVSVEHAVLCDQAPCALCKEDLVAKLDWLLHLAALNEIGVGLEDRVDLLPRGNLEAQADGPDQ